MLADISGNRRVGGIPTVVIAGGAVLLVVLALIAYLVTPHLGWKMALLTGLGAGLLFLAIAVIGSAIFKAEALGFGDVKMAVFIGLVLGLRPSVNAILTGIVLAGLVAVGLLVFRLMSARSHFAYGPFLAARTLIEFFRLGGDYAPNLERSGRTSRIGAPWRGTCCPARTW